MNVAWFRFRATWRRNLTSYLTVVLLIGLIGGVGMASVAAARRTQSSYPTFVASTNPSTLTMAVYSNNNGGQAGPNLKSKIEKLPGVRHVATAFGPPLVPLNSKGAPELNTLGYDITVGSTDGMFSRQDILGITQGRQANQNRVDQIVLTAASARSYGVHVGSPLTIGFYLPAQENSPDFGTPKVKPAMEFHTTVVGIGVLNSQVVQDGVDKVYGFMFITRAMVNRLLAKQPDHAPSLYGVQLDRGVTNVAKIEQEMVTVVPRGFQDEFHVTSQVESVTELAIKPESVALGGFGLIAALACLVLAAQAISRALQRGEEDRRVLRSLGAGPRSTIGEGLIGIAGSVVLGSLIAVVVAVGLSPLAPLGPVRPVYLDKGISFDWCGLPGPRALVDCRRADAIDSQRSASSANSSARAASLARRANAAKRRYVSSQCHRRALRTRAGTRTHVGAGAFGAGGHRTGGGPRRIDAYLCQWTADACLASGTLRMELELRAQPNE